MSRIGSRRPLDLEQLGDRNLPSTIIFPDTLVPPDTEFEVPVLARSLDGDKLVRGMNLRAQIGDGRGSGIEPVFTDVNYRDTIWSPFSVQILGGVVLTANGFDADEPQFVQSLVLMDNPKEASLVADGVVARLMIDATGIRSGTYEVRFADTPFPDSDFQQIPAETVSGNVIIASPGDSNLDGVFNSSDLIEVFRRGEYDDGVDFNSDWADGDWNGDGDFNSSDFVFAFAEGKYSRR